MRWLPSDAARLGNALAGACALAAITAPIRQAGGAINLSYAPASQTVHVGDMVSLALTASSDTSSTQLLAAAQAIITWNPAVLHLDSLSQTGAAPLLFSSFSPHPSGLNESNPPADGDGLYQCGALLGQRVAATPSGTVLTTLQFTALAPSASTSVGLPATLMGPGGLATTIVFDGVIPAFPVTGTLTGATIEILPSCGPPADLNCDGVVNTLDLGILLASWTLPPATACSGAACDADLNGDNVINSLDLGILLASWTL